MAIDETPLEVQPCETTADSVDEAKPVRWWGRAILVVLTLPWLAVFAVALSLNPYEEDGTPKRLGTHRQIVMPGTDEGLPECNFKALAGVPCPSCGMTTSFTMLMHADVWNSLRANFAGTALSTFGLLFIPWALMSAFMGRFVFIRSLETVIFRLAIIFLVVLFGRWSIVLVLDLLNQ